MTEVDSGDVRRQHRYELLTWPEINEAVAQSKVIVVPVGSIEQHGHHLPLDVDSKLVSSVCDATGGRAPELMLVMPTRCAYRLHPRRTFSVHDRHPGRRSLAVD